MRPEKKPFHAPYIDGLRAIAVLSVIVYHLNAKWLPGGFAGVDVFFVISGFVVAMSVSELGSISLGRFLAYFYARRLVRITPALVVMLLVTFIASAMFIPEAWLSSSNQRTGMLAFVGLSNFTLATNTGNYFSPVAEFNPFTHTWSLAVEEQFYFVFPWLFILWLRGRRALSVTIFGIAFAVSFACAIWLGRTDETRAFYMMWSRFWELGIGVLLFQIMHARGHTFDIDSQYRPKYAIASDIGLVALGVGLLVARADAAPFPACVLPVVGTALILGALHGRRGGIAYLLLTRKWMRYIGKISYSLYLWHWPVFVLFRWTVGLESPVWQVSALALTAVLSMLSHRFIEEPTRNAARGAKKSVMIAAGLALVASGYAVSTAVASNQSAISLSTVTRNALDWYPDAEKLDAAHGDCSVDTEAQKAGDGLLWVQRRIGCDTAASFPHQLFVIGDSHAMAYSPMLKAFVAETGATVYAYNNGGCPFMDFMPWHPGRSEVCERYGRAAVDDMLARIKPGDVVFLPSLRLPRLVEQWALFEQDAALTWTTSDEAKSGRESAERRALPILRRISAAGARIVFEGPTPVLGTIPYRCSDWFNRGNPICSRGSTVPRRLLGEMRAPILASYQAVAKQVSGVSVWDPFPLLCPAAQCSAFRGKDPLFFDGDHLSGYSNRLLLPSFTAFITGGPVQ
ncbi:acyltransferase [Burkholderia multivorans]|uniref:Acyltransferase n=1 Tax=Burkholderia multivorans TaxID=87883 RepID=A0AAP2HNP9_9BURK|nr:acyltransferase family protein [Burkholderia multivorans]MBU9359753.1 acyltransferase [Burkholderia multivorans]